MIIWMPAKKKLPGLNNPRQGWRILRRDEVKKYTFYLEGLGIEATGMAESERNARSIIWDNLSASQRDALVSMDCIDVTEIVA